MSCITSFSVLNLKSDFKLYISLNTLEKMTWPCKFIGSFRIPDSEKFRNSGFFRHSGSGFRIPHFENLKIFFCWQVWISDVRLRLLKFSSWPKSTYLSQWVLLVFEFLINLLLRLSPWLGLAMALIRATVILFPWNNKISRLSKKPTGILTM